ncbi:right-handed parallel beta-helix repeat-containing protein [Amycolatopsis sp. NPDC049868]|uniref:right-handed parallel beta-helix repeat-containing protein n=1 Tax=Amycolatopsis sp. NPDC049868 TaxID=3363934 RepID=UPI0037A8942C
MPAFLVVLLLVATGVVPAPAAPVAACAAGPVSPGKPDGAVVVSPGTDLSAKTRELPAGTTFWLTEGEHTLGPDEFGQIIPKDGNAYLGAPGAVLDGRGVNRYAFTQQARDVVIRGLTIRGFAAPRDQGVVNHDSGEHWTIEGNTIEDNRGAAMMAGPRQEILRNCLRNNGQYGINAYRFGGGITGLLVENNEITGNNTDDWETKEPGCGCSGGAKFWAVDGADIRGNWVHHNHGAGLWADTNNNDFLIEDNLIEDNEAEALFYEISYNVVVRGNTFRRNTLVQGRAFASRGDDFPVGTVYISESGGEPRVRARTSLVEIVDNVFEDNWSGITLWENADRFCNSPANTSSGSCTLLVPSVSSCSAPGISSRPLYDDCRWKTQRVSIHGNKFSHGSSCSGYCGRMALLANFGTYPDWSPYRGASVSDAVTFRQENRWYDNAYWGEWRFVVHDTSRTVGVAEWQGAPYSQDACSSFGDGEC